jgi:hypothetical protein
MGNRSFGASTFGRNNFGNAGFRGAGFGRFGFGGRGFGCWNCGFGWGFGLGFGWGWGWGGWWGPGWGLWGWNPYWYGPAWGWDDYGYYGYPSGNYNVTYPPEYSPSSDNSSYDYQSQPDYSTSTSTNSVLDSNTNPMTGNVAESTPTVLLYTTDGTTYPASDYWVADGKLHYNVDYSGESTMDINQLDLQRTVDENAKRGVRFTLKPKPNTWAPSTDTTSAPANGPASSPAATPTVTPAPAPSPVIKTTTQEQTALQ